MEEVKRSPFKFHDFFVLSANLKQEDNVQDVSILKFKISPSGEINEGKKQFKLFLQVDIISDDEDVDFSCGIKAMGLFDFKDVIQQDNISNYFFVNAPAIVYPYVRAYIASLTGLTGFQTVHLPPVNIGSLKKELEENIETVNRVAD